MATGECGTMMALMEMKSVFDGRDSFRVVRRKRITGVG